MTERRPASTAGDEGEEDARRRHPSALWVPDVDEIQRRIARRTPASNVGDEARWSHRGRT